MATRATYEIDGTVFYCHWDGYQEGAAMRFAKMIAADIVPQPDDEANGIDTEQPRRGGMAFAFIRGNLDAEPTDNNRHDAIGGTEFAYSVRPCFNHGWTVAVNARRDDGTWPRNFADPVPLADFVNEFGKAFDAPAIVTMRPPASAWNQRAPRLATLETARRLAEIEQAAGERFDANNPNRKIHLDRAAAWRAACGQAEQATQPALL